MCTQIIVMHEVHKPGSNVDPSISHIYFYRDSQIEQTVAEKKKPLTFQCIFDENYYFF